MNSIQVRMDNWFLRNVSTLKTAMRIVFGIIWGIDGSLKFRPGFVAAFSGLIAQVGAGQPAWLNGWFQFWSSTTSPNPAVFVYTTAFAELALSLALILGFLRKIAYTAGFFLSLLIWSVPEGFGGPYGPGSTDIGTGIIYALCFLLFILVNAAFGPSRYSLDFVLERKWPGWKRIAEIRST